MRIAFDLDGTLIDSASHIHQSVAMALSDLGLQTLDEPTVRSFIGRGLPNLIRRVLEHIGASETLFTDLRDKTLGYYVSLPTDPASVFPDVLETLQTLREAGHDLSICTNKPYHAALLALRDTDLAQHFLLVVGGDSFPVCKPDPMMLRACAPDLYVGDSEADAETAQANQTPFVLFTEGYRKSPVEALPHDHSFSRYSALPGLVAERASV